MTLFRIAPCAALLLILAPAPEEVVSPPGRPEGAPRRAAPERAPAAGKATTIALVRHAEKADGKGDVGLTPEGKKRARRLAEVFSRARIDALFSSELRRTAETLEPLALVKKLKVAAVKEPADLARALKALPAGSVALVCHHSYTLPDVMKALGVDPEAADGPDLALHDNLLLVTIHPSLEASLVNLAY